MTDGARGSYCEQAYHLVCQYPPLRRSHLTAPFLTTTTAISGRCVTWRHSDGATAHQTCVPTTVVAPPIHRSDPPRGVARDDADTVPAVRFACDCPHTLPSTFLPPHPATTTCPAYLHCTVYRSTSYRSRLRPGPLLPSDHGGISPFAISMPFTPRAATVNATTMPAPLLTTCWLSEHSFERHSGC